MIIDVIQIISAIALMIVIILQNRGSGLGSAFGGEGNVYRTRRSFEKVLFQLTIVLAVVFFVTAFANILF
jgi:preprotein translocase subunit SecG